MKKFWGVRHVRYWYCCFRYNRWWHRVGRHHWLIPAQEDLEYLRNVWEGKA
jgi:hypothetical protein